MVILKKKTPLLENDNAMFPLIRKLARNITQLVKEILALKNSDSSGYK